MDVHLQGMFYFKPKREQSIRSGKSILPKYRNNTSEILAKFRRKIRPNPTENSPNWALLALEDEAFSASTISTNELAYSKLMSKYLMRYTFPRFSMSCIFDEMVLHHYILLASNKVAFLMRYFIQVWRLIFQNFIPKRSIEDPIRWMVLIAAVTPNYSQKVVSVKCIWFKVQGSYLTPIPFPRIRWMVPAENNSPNRIGRYNYFLFGRCSHS